MAEEIKTAETTEEAVQADTEATVADVAQPQAEEPAKANEASKATDEQPKPEQTKEQNAEFARRRREAEKNASDKAIRNQAIIDALGGVNPFTGEAMKDEADVKEWEKMREMKANGLDPVADYRKTVKEEQRKEAERIESEAQRAKWFEDDQKAFVEKYPNVTLHGENGLLRDEGFAEYAQGKVGNAPLATIYEGYQKLLTTLRRQAAQDAAQVAAQNNSTPGPLSTPAGASQFFTREDVAKMSRDEIDKNWAIISESRKKW